MLASTPPKVIYVDHTWRNTDLGQQLELSLSPVFFLLPGIAFLDQDGSKDQMDLFRQLTPHLRPKGVFIFLGMCLEWTLRVKEEK